MPSMSGSPRSSITSSMSSAAAAVAGPPRARRRTGVALALEHAHEPGGDRSSSSTSRMPSPSCGSVRGPAAPSPRFDLALTWRRRGADPALPTVAAHDLAHRPQQRSMRLAAAIAAALAVLAAAAAVAGCGARGGNAPRRPRRRAAARPRSARQATSPTTRPSSLRAPRRAGSRVKVPEGWSRTRPAAPSTFTDKLNAIRLEPAAPRAADRSRRAARAAEARSTVAATSSARVDRHPPGRHAIR